MSQDQNQSERLREILDDADAASGSLLGDDGSSGDDLREVADRANDFVEDAEPEELLAAAGLAELPDGSEPDSVAAAISQGNPEDVEALRRLLSLSNLADREAGALEDSADALRESTASAADESDDAADESVLQGVAESVTDAVGDDGDADDGESAVREAAESVAEGIGDGEDSDLGDRLREAAESALGDAGGDVERLQQRLEEATESVGDDEDGDDTDADEGDNEDDGLLDTEFASSGDRGTSGSATRHSTMAPPPSKRADMKGTARHSTMPDTD